MTEPQLKIVQITTGAYSFRDYVEEEGHTQGIGHVLYGLDEDGIVYKLHPREKNWVKVDAFKNN